MSKVVRVRYVCSVCQLSIYYLPRMYARQTRFWPESAVKQCQASCAKPTVHYREVEQI